MAWVACTVSVEGAVYVMQQQGQIDEGTTSQSLWMATGHWAVPGCTVLGWAVA